MDVKDCFKIGYVSKSHGLKGEVTVVMSLDCPDLKSVKLLYIEIRQNLVPHFIESSSAQGGKAFVKLEEIDSAEAAALLKGSSLFLPKSERPALAKGQFYNDDVLGFEVIDEKIGSLGRVREVSENGLSRHLVVDYDNKEVLIPTNGPFIKNVQLTKKKITVDLPEGFLEI